MSPSNVDLVRALFEAYRDGNVDEALARVAADVVWNPFEEQPMQGTGAVRAYLRRWEDGWDDLETTPEEFVDAGDRVFVSVHFQGRGRGSGIEIQARSYHVYTVRDGKVVRMDEFTERSEALDAASASKER